MGNLSNQLGNQKAIISIDPKRIKMDMVKLLSFDLDFTENEEYFRDDTLELGYENEAERIVDEYLSLNRVVNKQDLFRCCDELLTKVFDSSFYGDWTLDVTESRNQDEYIVYATYQY